MLAELRADPGVEPEAPQADVGGRHALMLMAPRHDVPNCLQPGHDALEPTGSIIRGLDHLPRSEATGLLTTDRRGDRFGLRQHRRPSSHQ